MFVFSSSFPLSRRYGEKLPFPPSVLLSAPLSFSFPLPLPAAHPPSPFPHVGPALEPLLVLSPFFFSTYLIEMYGSYLCFFLRLLPNFHLLASWFAFDPAC